MNSWRRLFVKGLPSAPARKGQAVAAGAQEQEATGVFITPQTLTSFPVASTAIVIISGVITKLWPDTDSETVAAIVAFLIGILIFLINVPDLQCKSSGPRVWLKSPLR